MTDHAVAIEPQWITPRLPYPVYRDRVAAALAVMHGACAEVPELDTVQARGADGATVTVARRDAPLCG